MSKCVGCNLNNPYKFVLLNTYIRKEKNLNQCSKLLPPEARQNKKSKLNPSTRKKIMQVKIEIKAENQQSQMLVL